MSVFLRLSCLDRKWVESVTTEEGLLVENLSLKAYPVTVYRCSGRFPCGATVRQIAQAAFALEERRRWDHELSRSSRVLEQLTDSCVVEYVTNADGALGGLVSGREYVDVRTMEARGSNGRVWWGSVEWDRSTGNEDAKLVRAWNYPQGFTFQEYEPGLFLLRLTIHRDYRGWLPYTAAESGMPQYIALLWKQFVDYLRKGVSSEGVKKINTTLTKL